MRFGCLMVLIVMLITIAAVYDFIAHIIDMLGGVI